MRVQAVARVGPEVDREKRVVTHSDALPLKRNEGAAAVDLVVFTISLSQLLRCVFSCISINRSICSL